MEDKEITDLPIERRGLSYVPQDLALFPHMTVRENILYPVRIRGNRQDIENGIVQELVDSLGIRHLLDRSVQNLSGGERQRTALARAVASGCKYLVLDEPLSALHESLKKELWYLVRDLQSRYDLAILMVTHDLEEAFFLGDTISIIIDGTLHQQGSKAEVYHCPASIEVARFLGIGNLFQGTVESRTRDYLSIYCKEIGTALRASTRARTSTTADRASVVAGIRSEDVLIVMPGDQGLSEINVLEGTIRDVYENGAARTIIVTCAPYSTSLEVIVTPWHVQRTARFQRKVYCAASASGTHVSYSIEFLHPILYVTHSVPEIQVLADQIVLVENGSGELLENPEIFFN